MWVTETFGDKKGVCKECSCKTMRFNYRNKFISYLRYRYKSIESQSKKHNTQCLTFDEFVKFAKTEKEPIFQLTLEEAFNKGLAGNFDIDHKKAISKSGTSLINNLTLSYKPFNRLKGTMNVDKTLEIAKLIVNHENEIKLAYNK